MKHEQFTIDHIDPLGQGVAKQSGRVIFIPKTLPEEKVQAEVHKKKGKVEFATLIKVQEPSHLRELAKCPHYSQCKGCHYLHTSYEEELNFKKMALARLLAPLPIGPEIQVYQSEQRDHYRNRLQLHYNKSDKLLGLIEPIHQRILPIPNCQLPQKELIPHLEALYHNNEWLKRIPDNSPRKGHVEIYQLNGEVQITWNQHYSAGGFTQVNAQMNQLLIETLHQELREENIPALFDLFGGKGNLTHRLDQVPTMVIDSLPFKNGHYLSHQTYLQADLYKSNILEHLEEKIPARFNQADHLIIDPPRSGWKDLPRWQRSFKRIDYISCFAPTMIRDIRPLVESGNYKIAAVRLFDFFPSTHHFETHLTLIKS